jgi:ribosomal protein S18 acetylase RimI-like enzyme
MMEIREAELQDISAMRAVAISSYIDTFASSNTQENMDAFLSGTYSLEKLEQEFIETNSMLFLAVEDNEVAGFARLRESDEVLNLLGKNTVELQRLYVLTSAQGKSVGSLLMEKSMTHAKQNKYEWIWLGVWEKNYKAQKFYKNWGFEKFSEHTFWMGDDPQIDWLFKKRL